MKHRVKFRKLHRDSEHRWAMLRNMVDSLIQHERIKTTHAKAKEVQRFAEWMVTIGRKGDTDMNRVKANKILRTDVAANKLFDVLGPRYKLRPGGSTRVMKIGWRKGDNADMAIIEFVDREGEIRPANKVDEGTIARNHFAHYKPLSRLLPSRAPWIPR